jgi:hypothetical protein
MGHKQWMGDHVHAVAKGRGHCRCGGTAQEEDDWGEKSPDVKNDDGSVVLSTRNGTKLVVDQGCWVDAPEGGGKNYCSSMSAYGSGSCKASCPNLSGELLVWARAVKWKMGSHTIQLYGYRSSKDVHAFSRIELHYVVLRADVHHIEGR